MEQLQHSEAPLKIEELLLKKATLIVRAVNHKLRQQILQLLHQHGRLSVKEIYIKLRLEQSVASQQLAILRTAGFVIATRVSKQVYYSVNYQRLQEVHQFAAAILQAKEIKLLDSTAA